MAKNQSAKGIGDIHESSTTQFALILDARVMGEPVEVFAEFATGSSKLGWEWKLGERTLRILAKALGLNLDALPETVQDFKPGSIHAEFLSGENSRTLSFGVGNFADFLYITEKPPGGGQCWGIVHEEPIRIPVGGGVGDLIGDQLTISRLRIGNVSGKFQNPKALSEAREGLPSSKLLLGSEDLPPAGFVAGIAFALGAGGAPMEIPPAVATRAKKLEEVPPPASDEKPSSPGQLPAKSFPVGKTLGPLRIDRVGFELMEKEKAGKDGKEIWIGLVLDAGIELASLKFGLTGFKISVPPFDLKPENIRVDLEGLELAFKSGPMSISGGFFKTEVEVEVGNVKTRTTQFDGMALIKAANFTITGFGSYAVVAKQPSLFIFAVLHKELGGPPCFRVNGLAAGFGYNRKLKLPPIEEVQNFPLVRAALDENYFDNSTPGKSIQSAMEKLRHYIPQSLGEYWFAAGVRFSSFEMVQSFALLSVSSGMGVEIGLLGLSRLTLPKGAKDKDAVASVELALRAVINVDEGIISVEGRLTDKSFIFTKDCRLTGGFAFFVWCAGEYAGDFVVTLGGYHPKFIRPERYPLVPRLGVNWQVTSQLAVTAEMYFALTPSCIMTGGKLSAVYHSGCIKAWFIVHADFLLSWQPFYYLVDMGISIGVQADVRIPLGFVTISFSIRVELSVELHLWGPPFAGEARVDLTVISFTIPFGPPRKSPEPLTADEFVKEFLPPPAADGMPPVIAVRIDGGLIQERERVEDEGKKVVRVVNAHALSLTAESVIPSTRFGGLAGCARHKEPGKSRPGADSFGIRPMCKSLTSTLEVILWKGDTCLNTPQNLQGSFVESGVPDALWGRNESGKIELPSRPEAITITATQGVRFSFLPFDPEHKLAPIPLEKLEFEQLPTKEVEWQDPGEAAGTSARGTSTFWSTIWGNGEVNTRRNAILDVLRSQSPFAMNEPKLEQVQQSERHYFQSDPELCTLGEASSEFP